MTNNNMIDEVLVKGCREKKPEVQKYLYDKFAKKMMGICMRYASRLEEAEDILQNGFIKVFENIHKFRGDGSLEGWIRKIMINAALDHLRRTKSMKNSVQTEEIEYRYPSYDPSKDLVDKEALLRIIQSLPTGFRTVFNLYAIEGYSHKEIAQKLGISENTSKSQYSRARAQLKKMIRIEKVI